MQSLSIAEARRIAIAAQQFGASVRAKMNVRSLTGIVRRLGAVQIDSVNVLVRSHYLPFYSRLGAYPMDLLEQAAYGERRTLFEYWGHEASFLPIECWPLFQWRMERARRGEAGWRRLRRYATEHAGLVADALAQIRDRGPLSAGELNGGGRSSGAWWGWSQGKEILEWLFWTGQVATARRRNFERLYDLSERVVPPAILNARTPSADEAQRALVMIAARALGVATLRDLREYFRLPTTDAAHRLRELVEAGELEPVSVEGWKQTAYVTPDAASPRSIAVSALLSPFDSLVWDRDRTLRLFDFHYRLEIYTPSHKRLHGYYVLPFLHGDRLIGRVDLKADRKRGRLEVRGGSLEAGRSPTRAAGPLMERLSELASWLGLDEVAVISRRGDLMRALRSRKRARTTKLRRAAAGLER